MLQRVGRSRGGLKAIANRDIGTILRWRRRRWRWRWWRRRRTWIRYSTNSDSRGAQRAAVIRGRLEGQVNAPQRRMVEVDELSAASTADPVDEYMGRADGSRADVGGSAQLRGRDVQRA